MVSLMSLWLPILILAVPAGVGRSRSDETAPQDPAAEPIRERQSVEDTWKHEILPQWEDSEG